MRARTSRPVPGSTPSQWSAEMPPNLPIGKFGGISADHWLGVEPGTGRDVLARMVYGITWSLFIALSATFVAMAIGTVLGIIGGFAGGFTDSVIGRAIDLTLSFPSTMML